jgi:hypothetical protein
MPKRAVSAARTRGCRLDRCDVRVAGVVDDNVDSAEPRQSGLERGLSCGVGDVELDGEDLPAVLIDKVVELRGRARGRDDRVTGL